MTAPGAARTAYAGAAALLDWELSRAELSGLPGDRGLNIAHEAVDRQVAAGHGAVEAVRGSDAQGRRTSLTYAQLRRETNRFAHVLLMLGVGQGDRVATLLGSRPEQHVAALGTLKVAAVYAPLLPCWAPEAVGARLRLARARVLITTAALFRRRVGPLLDRDAGALPDLRHVLVVDEPADPRTSSLVSLMADAAEEHTIPPTSPGDPALLQFTSGTTGRPRAAVHVHEAVVAHHASARSILGLEPGDVLWTTAEPGWAAGTTYGILAPLTRGATVLARDGDHEARGWPRLLAEEEVNVWFTTPGALRSLARAGTSVARTQDLSRLRLVVSTGEAADPELLAWAEHALGVPVHDAWGQTETGVVMVGTCVGAPARSGSIGRPVPGAEAAVLARSADGGLLLDRGRALRVPPGATGELALRPGWPSMFRDYLDEGEDQYLSRFAAGWYLTGDLARQDEDGYLWFVGRADDLVHARGRLVGPAEVETALMEHPAVAEAGVIGRPDPVAGEVVKAFVTTRTGFAPSEELRGELLAYGRDRLGPLAPDELDFDQHLPHTGSGTVLRRLLRARELGLPVGDVSTLDRGGAPA